MTPLSLTNVDICRYKIAFSTSVDKLPSEHVTNAPLRGAHPHMSFWDIILGELSLIHQHHSHNTINSIIISRPIQNFSIINNQSTNIMFFEEGGWLHQQCSTIKVYISSALQSWTRSSSSTILERNKSFSKHADVNRCQKLRKKILWYAIRSQIRQANHQIRISPTEAHVLEQMYFCSLLR